MKIFTTLRIIKQQNLVPGSQGILTIEDFKTKSYKDLPGDIRFYLTLYWHGETDPSRPIF